MRTLGQVVVASLTMLVLLSAQLIGNDSYVNIAGGEISLETENRHIGIRSEELRIHLFDSHYVVHVDYTFFNSGPAQTVTTAFPEYRTSEGLYSKDHLGSFQISYGTGEEIPHSYQESELKLAEYFRIVGWYVKEIFFAANTETRIRISYTSDYNHRGSYRSADYLLGTGRTWNGTIEDLTVTLVNESDLWIDEVQLGNSLEYEYAILGEDRYKVRVRNWEPELMDEIRVLTQRYPLYDRIPYRTTQSRFLFRDSALSPRWFSFLNSSQLRILRNSIYAMRGYRFDSEDMSRHFEQEDWYSPADGFSEALFSEIERHNIDVIYAIERIVQQTR